MFHEYYFGPYLALPAHDQVVLRDGSNGRVHEKGTEEVKRDLRSAITKVKVYPRFYSRKKTLGGSHWYGQLQQLRSLLTR